MIKRMVSVMASCPPVFDALRWTLEWGYGGHKEIIRRDILPAGGSVLDFGCGTGIYAPHFEPGSYVGIDVNPEYIFAAKKKYPKHDFRVMDGRQLDFEPNSFDKAYISGVLHHLDDETSSAVLKEIARVLKKNGKLVVWEDVPTPAAWNFVGELVHKLDEGPYIRPAKSYQVLLENDFKLEAQRPMRSGFMDYAVFILRKR